MSDGLARTSTIQELLLLDIECSDESLRILFDAILVQTLSVQELHLDGMTVSVTDSVMQYLLDVLFSNRSTLRRLSLVGLHQVTEGEWLAFVSQILSSQSALKDIYIANNVGITDNVMQFVINLLAR